MVIRREERMDDGIDNEALDAGSDSVDEIDPYDSPEQSYSQDIIDEIEQYDKHDVEPSPAISLPGNIRGINEYKPIFSQTLRLDVERNHTQRQ